MNSTIDDLEEAKAGQWGEDIDFGGVLPEQLDGADAVGIEDVMNIRGEVMADGGGWDRDAGGPLLDEIFDVEKAVVTRGFEVFGEFGSRNRGWGFELGNGLWADGPDGSHPRQLCADVPLVGEIVPLAWADGGFFLVAGVEGAGGGGLYA